MRNLLHYFIACMVLGFVLSFSSCEKDELPDNPFDIYNPIDSNQIVTLSPTSIEGLYKNVFKPTCANSGCHDGTFEPDFRTIESTYYSLVYQDIIKQNPSNLMDYRVLPGNANQSILIERLTVDLGGNSGIMPLVVDPSSDWNDKSMEYIANIRTWINEGAKDIFGNPAVNTNFKPQLLGSIITANGSSTPLGRNVEGVIEIPQGSNSIDIYIAINDKETPAASLISANLQLSLSADNFSNAAANGLSLINPQSFIAYSGSNTNYYHKLTITNPYSIWTQNQVVFMNVLVDDGDNGELALPGLSAMEHIKNYYSFKMK